MTSENQEITELRDSLKEIPSLRLEITAAKEEVSSQVKLIEYLNQQIEEMSIEYITTLKSLKSLGEEIVLSHGNHTEKKILASAICNQANKTLRQWHEKKKKPAYIQSYRRLLRDARLDAGQELDNDF